MNQVVVALSLMREALTLLDEPQAYLIDRHLRLAIEAAEHMLAGTSAQAQAVSVIDEGEEP